jgi:RNA polymerase primary sigma factor
MPSVDLEKIWLAASAEKLSAQYYARDEFVPDPIEAQFMENIGAVDEAVDELRTRLGDLGRDPQVPSILMETLLGAEIGENEGTICLRAVTRVLEKTDLDSDIKEYEPLETVDDSNEVFVRINSSHPGIKEEAQVAIVERYGRFVKNRAWKLIRRLPHAAAVDVEDLIQEGMSALLLAATTHDVNVGATFLTYAGKAVHWRMMRHYEDMRGAVRLPANIRSKINKVNAFNNQRLNSRQPLLSMEEIAEFTGVEPEYQVARQNDRTTVGNLQEAHLLSDLMGSIDTGYSPRELGPKNEYIIDEAVELESVTQNAPAVRPDEQAIREMLSIDVAKALECLTIKEREVVELRFGLTDGKVRTLEEVGKAFNVNRERIRQIEAKALAKIRGNQARSSGHLSEYLEDPYSSSY